MSGKHNGIPWREWSEEAFAEAKAVDKPVLLDIGAVWCHWCHVMDDGIPGDPNHTGTYSHPEVQARIRQNFIPIKVDTDKRPDINARYNMGGWPTTAFLTPDGDTLYGETYVTPQKMIYLLDTISDAFTNQRDRIDEQNAHMKAQRAQIEESATVERALSATIVDEVVGSLLSEFDSLHGGFGREPKFPHPAALTFALEQYALTGNSAQREIAEKTMDGMASGGMYDQFAGGFFRYSTTRDWSIPHYEKMLEDNSKLICVYSLAASVLGDRSYLEVVRTTHDWLNRDMRDSQTGAFAGSQDADREEEYYGQPLDARANMPTPYIDRTIYADWNALMVSGFAARYRLTGERDVLDSAIETYGFLLSNLTELDEASESPARVLQHYWDGGQARGVRGLLSDQCDFAAAALDLYEITGQMDYLDHAQQTAAWVLAHLQDGSNGGFYDLCPDEGAIGELAHPKLEISQNADVSLCLLRLWSLTGNVTYQEQAVKALNRFADSFGRLSYFASQYARAVQAAIRDALKIVIVGPVDHPETFALQHAAWQVVIPGKVTSLLDPTALSLDKLEQLGYSLGPNGEAYAYVCVGTHCHRPVAGPEALTTLLRGLA